jgi:hypothetical protein
MEVRALVGLRRRWLALLAVLTVTIAAWTAVAVARADNYVSLGDSYVAGPFIPNPTLPLGCLKSDHNYPHLAAGGIGLTLRDPSCSGAKTDHMTQPQNVDPDGPNPPQFNSLDASATVVSLTIGGNDIGFSDLIVQCTLADCSAALDNTRANLRTVLAPRLDTVYSSIRSRALGATVVVLGYPRMFSTAGCLGTLGISSTERAKANLLSEALDTLSSERAGVANVTYQSAIAPFTGHAVCSSSSWLNGLNLLNTGESYHPNRNGNSLGYAPLVRSVVG